MQSNYGFSGQDNPNDFKKYVEKETDLTHDSPFHTLGKGATQAAPGAHKHTASEITDLPAGLTVGSGIPKQESGSGSAGVSALASREDHVHPAGPGGLAVGNIAPPVDSGTGGAGSSPNAARADHYHPAHNVGYADNAGNADTVDGQHLNWHDREHMSLYVWGVTNYSDSFLVWTGRFAHAGHGHDYAPSSHGQHIANSGSAVVTTNIAGSVYFGTGCVGGIPIVVNGDFNAHARAPHILSWDDCGISVGNMNANQAVRLNWIRV